jgi:hypothetical protein
VVVESLACQVSSAHPDVETRRRTARTPPRIVVDRHSARWRRLLLISTGFLIGGKPLLGNALGDGIHSNLRSSCGKRGAEKDLKVRRTDSPSVPPMRTPSRSSPSSKPMAVRAKSKAVPGKGRASKCSRRPSVPLLSPDWVVTAPSQRTRRRGRGEGNPGGVRSARCAWDRSAQPSRSRTVTPAPPGGMGRRSDESPRPHRQSTGS